MTSWIPKYAHGEFEGRDIYVVSTGPLMLKTNKDYHTAPGIPACQDGHSADPDAVYQISKQIMDVIIKAGLKAAHIPAELATFAGPLTKQLAKDVEGFVHQNGGDIKKFLDAIGASHTYASCLPMSLVVPKGSTIRSIDTWTNRRAKPAGSYKKGDRPFDVLPEGHWERATRRPSEKSLYDAQDAAWRVSEAGVVISGILMNWSNTDDLGGKLQVFFDPPHEWQNRHPLNKATERL